MAWFELNRRRIAFGALLLGVVTESAPAADRLTLTPSMVINESGLGDARLLVDEQDSVGEPPTAVGSRPERPYFPGWQSWKYPAHLVIDLGSNQQATNLSCFNETGVHQLLISTGAPTQWAEPRKLALDGYRQWHSIAIDPPTRYLRLTTTAPTSLPEIVVHGMKGELATKVPSPTKIARERPTFDQFLGVNAFIDDPINRIVPVAGTVREYHNVGWDHEHSDRGLRLQPSAAAGGNAWFFDDFYAKFSAQGVVIAPCLQQSLPWITGNSDLDAKPARLSTDAADPASYSEHAAYMYQFAARYGKRRVPEQTLALAAGQPPSSGLALIRYFENANEPDKDWKERACFSSPFELAAQCSADRDGHRGALGPVHGIRAADPDAKLVLGGLYHTPLVYLDAIRFWADHHRGGEFPIDVINFHHYCGDGDAEQAFKTGGLSPEDGRLRERAAEIVAWRDQNSPGAEVWITEFGYDTNPGSPLHAPAIGKKSAEVVQAAWLVRSNLLLAAARIDRATMFMFRDVDSKSPNVFATSGLVTEKGSWVPKPAWYFQATLRKHLAGLRFDGDLPSGRGDVAMMRFAGGGKSAIALWCPTARDHRAEAVNVAISPRAGVRLLQLDERSAEGKLTRLEIVDGAVSVDVSEVPLFLLVD